MIKKPFVLNPQINAIIETINSLLEQNELLGSSPSMLLTGEAGCGKSEIAKRFIEKHPIVEEEERTNIPMIHVELKSVGTQKDLYRSLLRAIKDPQQGQGGKNAQELLERFIKLANVVGLKLLFIDEIQVVIEGRSHKVRASLADSFKDLVKGLNIPVIFVGVPWSKYLIEANEQLSTRVQYRLQLKPFKISNNQSFKSYRKVLKLLGSHYGEDTGFSLSEPNMALRVFSFTSGCFRTTTNLIEAAYYIAKKNNSQLNMSCFASAVASFGHLDNDNPFRLELTDLYFTEQISESDWTFNSKGSSLLKPRKVTYVLESSGDLIIKESA